MPRLHVITGDRDKARSEAELLKDLDPNPNWMILDAFNPDALAGLLRSRNVIWVVELHDEVAVSSHHCVALPTTFGSVIEAATSDDRPKRKLCLGVGSNWWIDSEGKSYSVMQLIEARVLFDTKEA